VELIINKFLKGVEALEEKISVTKYIQGDSFAVTVCIDPFNERIRVDDYLGNLQQAIGQAEKMVTETKAKKLIVKVRLEHFNEFLVHGFCCEGKIDGYFLGSDAYFFVKYYDNKRRNSDVWITYDEIIKKITSLPRSMSPSPDLLGLNLRKVTLSDIGSLAALYKEVFQIYPTPLHDPEYIKKTLQEGTIYYCFQEKNKIVSAASAEVNLIYKNAELTDCATLMSHRKHGLMKFLLQKLEEYLQKNGIYCAYSLARAKSYGMNAVFHQIGYSYRGRLMNNCYIYKQLEDMNVWVKDLSINKNVPNY
jgi:beta-lysine N6-acetyltransferase